MLSDKLNLHILIQTAYRLAVYVKPNTAVGFSEGFVLLKILNLNHKLQSVGIPWTLLKNNVRLDKTSKPERIPKPLYYKIIHPINNTYLVVTRLANIMLKLHSGSDSLSGKELH